MSPFLPRAVLTRAFVSKAVAVGASFSHAQEQKVADQDPKKLIDPEGGGGVLAASSSGGVSWLNTAAPLPACPRANDFSYDQYLYVGPAASTRGFSASYTLSSDSPSRGWSGGFQGTAVGSYQQGWGPIGRGGSSFSEFGVGAPVGASGSVFYAWRVGSPLGCR